MCMTNRRYNAYYVDVEIWCEIKKKMVTLTLESNTKQHGKIVMGRPICCSEDSKCSADIPIDSSIKKRGTGCFLNMLQIETGRKQ